MATTSVDREHFLEAITRHRRASWRVTAACAIAVIVLALVVAILMAPLLYCLIALGFDVVNFITPMPDLMTRIGNMIDPLVSSGNVSVGLLLRVGALAALPGLVLMAAATHALRHVWRTSPLFRAGDLPGRPPNRTVLNEERLANVLEEMAIAAGIPVPHIVIVPGGVNAAACGYDQDHVTIVVGEALVANVSREQLEGAIAHLVGSIADGDMTIGLRVTTTLALFGLVAKVGTSFNDRRTFMQTAKLWRVFVAPTSANTVALLGALGDPFHNEAPTERRVSSAPSAGSNNLTWREWLLMPLMGPVMITGFLAGLVTGFVLEPLVALAWRQRKYMADATAVQLTRNPDSVATALAVVGDSPKGIAAWTAHLAVAAGRYQSSGPFGMSIVPIFPSVEKRGKALVRMGAHIAPDARRHLPWPIVLVMTVLFSIVGVLICVVIYLLVMVSAALSGIFTIMPAAALHFLLRWLSR